MHRLNQIDTSTVAAIAVSVNSKGGYPAQS